MSAIAEKDPLSCFISFFSDQLYDNCRVTHTLHKEEEEQSEDLNI
jgi:hypothetical protein